MKRFNRGRCGVTNLAFAGTAIVLIVIAGIGYGLYATSSSKTLTVMQTQTQTNMMTETNVMTETMTQTSMMAANNSYAFTPASGAMITNAWLLVVPIGMNETAVSIHAEGLEVNGTYIVEGALRSGSMQTVPISSQSMNMNTTAGSEFQTDRNGTGTYWIELTSNPTTTFENIQLYLVPGGMMANATLVATVTFAMSP